MAELERQVHQLSAIIEKQTHTLDSKREGVASHSGEYSMAEQVQTIESKMQRLSHTGPNSERGSQSTEAGMLRAQVVALQNENEAIRKSFSSSYQELLDAFNSYKKQMEEQLSRKSQESDSWYKAELEAKTQQVS